MQLNRSLIIKLLVVLGGLLIIGLVVYALIPRATIVFAVAPQEITVVINGNEHTVKNGDSVNVAPGEITLELKRDEFESYGETFVLENGETREVLAALEPLTEAARQLLLNNGSQIIIERIGANAVEQGAEALEAEYPILLDLPINERFYTILICESERKDAKQGDLAVCVRLYEPQARQAALNTIERRGYSLDDYEIIVQDFSYENLQQQASD